MEWQWGNKQRPNYWQWRRSFILGDSNWKYFQGGYRVDMYLSPNWMLSRVWSVKHIFQNALSRAHRGVLVPTSLWLCPIDSLPFATVVFWLHFFFFFFKKNMERKLLCQLFTATNWFARLLSIQLCSSRYWAMRVSCLVVTSRRSRDRNPGFQLQTAQLLEASCFSFKSILLRTSGKCLSIKRIACMLNFSYIVQCKWYLRLKISFLGPFKESFQMTTIHDGHSCQHGCGLDRPSCIAGII